MRSVLENHLPSKPRTSRPTRQSTNRIDFLAGKDITLSMYHGMERWCINAEPCLLRCQSFDDIRRRAGSSLGLGGGGANIPEGSPSRGSDVMRTKVRKGGGADEKICITTSLTRYMQVPRNVFQSGVLSIR